MTCFVSCTLIPCCAAACSLKNYKLDKEPSTTQGTPSTDTANTPSESSLQAGSQAKTDEIQTVTESLESLSEKNKQTVEAMDAQLEQPAEGLEPANLSSVNETSLTESCSLQGMYGYMYFFVIGM